MSHSGDTNKMVETPRTDAAYFEPGATMYDLAGEMKRVERELNAANEKIEVLLISDCERLRIENELNAANERIKRLRDGIAKQNQTIEQACGKALGYPWFKDDQKNFPGSTEKDGVCVGEHVAETVVCELVGKYTEALARIKRLEEAGDALKAAGYFGGWADAVNKWIKVREDKP